jgi:hypothetical protein
MFWKASLLGAAAAIALHAAPAAAATVPAPTGIDPIHPFTGVTKGQQWIDKFRTGKKVITPGDPFGNMTVRQFDMSSFYGELIGRTNVTPANLYQVRATDKEGEHPPIRDLSGDTGGTGIMVRSPYPYKTAQEHYDAWLKAANGGTRKTRATLPDWSGDWLGGLRGPLSFGARIADLMDGLTPEYRKYYTDALRANWEGHAWWATAFCFPDDLLSTYAGNGSSYHFMPDEHEVLISVGRPTNMFRVIYTDGRGFLPEDRSTPQWYGESEGFWDGDELVIHSRNFRPWTLGANRPESSDQLELVERMKRIGDEMLVDITLYDPKAFAYPWHEVGVWRTSRENWLDAPSAYVSCEWTNHAYLGEDGAISERSPGDPGFQDPTELRPWAAAYETWAKAHPDLHKAWEASFARDEAAARASAQAK